MMQCKAAIDVINVLEDLFEAKFIQAIVADD